jgi:hypothetical protein
VDLQSWSAYVDFVPNHLGRAVIKREILFGWHKRGDIDREMVKNICPIAYR